MTQLALVLEHPARRGNLDPRPRVLTSADAAHRPREPGDPYARIPWLHDAHRSRPSPTTEVHDWLPLQAAWHPARLQPPRQPWPVPPPLVWVRESVAWVDGTLQYRPVDGLPTIIRAARAAWSPRRYTAPHMPRRFARLWLVRGEDGLYRRWRTP